MAAHIPYMLAPGMGALLPGFVKLPVLTNPVTYVAPGGAIARDSSGHLLAPTVGMGRRATNLGAYMAASFPVPQNPVYNYITGKGYGSMASGGLAGCGCGGSCGGCGSHGMGQLDFSLTDIMSGNAGIETYAVIGAGVLALLWAFGGRKKYAQSRQARAGRKAKLAAASEKYYEALGSNPRRKRNVAAGFYDEDGYFHPIRASYDYDRKRGGDRPKRRKR